MSASVAADEELRDLRRQLEEAQEVIASQHCALTKLKARDTALLGMLAKLQAQAEAAATEKARKQVSQTCAATQTAVSSVQCDDDDDGADIAQPCYYFEQPAGATGARRPLRTLSPNTLPHSRRSSAAAHSKKRGNGRRAAAAEALPSEGELLANIRRLGRAPPSLRL